MNTLFTRQTEPSLTKLLAAQKQTYIEGKRVNSLIFLISLLSAIGFPLLLLFFPEYNTWVGILGGSFSIIVSLLFKETPAKIAKTGAKIQEEFDTELFELSWNKPLVGTKVNKHIIERAANRLKDRSNIDERPWYKDYSKLEHSHAVLHCMQENLYWSSTQKKRFSNFLIILAVTIFILGWIWGFVVLKLEHTEYLLQVFFPLSGFLIYLIKTIRTNIKASLAEAEKGTFAQVLSEKHKDSSKPIPEEDLRSLQDSIFALRQTGNLIPEWFYKFYKKEFEETLEGTANDINQ